jgi:hypothetical protein
MAEAPYKGKRVEVEILTDTQDSGNTISSTSRQRQFLGKNYARI